MESVRSVQTAFRFRPEMLARMKNRARQKDISLNAYIERLVEEDLKESSDRYEALYAELSQIRIPEKMSEEMKTAFSYIKMADYTEAEIQNDPRLAAIFLKDKA